MHDASPCRAELARLHLIFDKKQRSKLRSTIATCALLIPGLASAQVSVTSDYVARMDGDYDGRVSLLEYQDWLSYGFDAMDRNRDSVLTIDELPGGRDNVITREQHRATLADTFNHQDADKDGFLSAAELAAPPQ